MMIISFRASVARANRCARKENRGKDAQTDLGHERLLCSHDVDSVLTLTMGCRDTRDERRETRGTRKAALVVSSTHGVYPGVSQNELLITTPACTSSERRVTGLHNRSIRTLTYIRHCVASSLPWQEERAASRVCLNDAMISTLRPRGNQCEAEANCNGVVNPRHQFLIFIPRYRAPVRQRSSIYSEQQALHRGRRSSRIWLPESRHVREVLLLGVGSATPLSCLALIFQRFAAPQRRLLFGAAGRCGHGLADVMQL